MEVLEDAASKEMIWINGNEMITLKGLLIQIIALKFTAAQGRFYSNFRSEDFEVQSL
jgi:hypothetical protein